MNLALAKYLEHKITDACRELKNVAQAEDRLFGISWNLEVDPATGKVTAIPSYSKDCTHLEHLALVEAGIVSKTVCTFGPLVQLIPRELSDDEREMLKKIGLPTHLGVFYVKAVDAAEMRAFVGTLFTIDEPTPVDLWLRGLPNSIDWSNIEGFNNRSDTDVRFWGASFTKARLTWTIIPTSETHTTEDLNSVSVTWNIRHDPETGEYWADPVFKGYNVNHGPTDLQGLCTAMGIAKPRLYEPVAASPTTKV